MTTETTTTMRRCIGSTRFGIEAHDAPSTDFPAQPSQKDGLGRMCHTHWRAVHERAPQGRRRAEGDGGQHGRRGPAGAPSPRSRTRWSPSPEPPATPSRRTRKAAAPETGARSQRRQHRRATGVSLPRRRPVGPRAPRPGASLAAVVSVATRGGHRPPPWPCGAHGREPAAGRPGSGVPRIAKPGRAYTRYAASAATATGRRSRVPHRWDGHGSHGPSPACRRVRADGARR